MRFGANLSVTISLQLIMELSTKSVSGMMRLYGNLVLIPSTSKTPITKHLPMI